MSEHHHDLVTDFPEHKEHIHELKMGNAHFRKLFEQYTEFNKLIYRAENRLDVISEHEEEVLRKKRLQTKDELYKMLLSTAA